MLDAYADRWALVTGASSGIGEEFAHRLAARGMHLVLTARREDRLRALAAELDTRHGTQTLVLANDLTAPDAVDRVTDFVTEHDLTIELLVNNAGFAVVDALEGTDPARVAEMLQLNVQALTRLTYAFLPGMLEREHGAILNVASVAGFQPVAYMGAYSASKAYVLHFSEALWAEVRDRGVTVTALCPGVTKTEFFDVAGVGGWLRKRRASTPEEVVRCALKGLEKRRPSVTCGWRDFFTTMLVRLTPRKLVVTESMKYFRPQAGQEAAASDVGSTSASATANDNAPPTAPAASAPSQEAAPESGDDPPDPEKASAQTRSA